MSLIGRCQDPHPSNEEVGPETAGPVASRNSVIHLLVQFLVHWRLRSWPTQKTPAQGTAVTGWGFHWPGHPVPCHQETGFLEFQVVWAAPAMVTVAGRGSQSFFQGTGNLLGMVSWAEAPAGEAGAATWRHSWPEELQEGLQWGQLGGPHPTCPHWWECLGFLCPQRKPRASLGGACS